MFMGPALAHLGAAAGRKLLRARARLRRGFSIGIAGRLATSFAAVAVLAIATNVMIEREIAVVQTTRLDRGQYSPVPDTRTPALASMPATTPPSTITHETVHSEMPTPVARFQSALEHYQRAIETRVSRDTSPAEDGRGAAQRDLDLAAKALGKEQAGGRAVQTALTSYERAGADYVDSADQRRLVL
jgi:hypothetical protein